MSITYLILGLWGASLSLPAGWILGTRVGDTIGLFGYAAATLSIAAGITAAIGW